MPAVTDDELKRLKVLAELRALEQRVEADRAGAIASRDERVVAGEDTERSATTAANLAKQQLSGAAGKGAAALAGMMAAQKARDSEFASLLQRARDRKDRYEQLEVDRRAKAFGTQGQASAVEQTRLRDNYLSDLIDDMNTERTSAQEWDKSKASGTTYTNTDPLSGNKTKVDTVWSTLPKYGEDIVYKGVVIPSSSSGYEAAFDAILDTISEAEQKEWDDAYNSTSEAVGLQAFEDAIRKKDMPALRKLIKSDANLKEVYADCGPNAGKVGNAKKSAKIAVKRAEKWLEDDGDGVNEVLVERFSHG